MQADYARSFDAIQKRIAARAAVPKTCESRHCQIVPEASKEIAKAVECLLRERGGAQMQPGIGDAGIGERLGKRGLRDIGLVAAALPYS